MLTELCQELKNWFCKESDKNYGSFTISDGVLSPSSFLQEGQCFRIKGSVFNDGVHKFGDDDLNDEAFIGEVWAMRIPQAVIELSEKIDGWKEANAKALSSPYQSESWGGYSYSLKGDASSSSGANGWKAAFASDLNRWRKV